MSERTITVGGKDYELKLTLKSVRLIGEHLGIKIRPAHVDEDVMNQPLELGALGVVLWACLQHHAEAPTLDDVENSVDQDNFGDVLERFFGLFGATSKAKALKEAFLTASQEQPATETEETPVAA